MADIVFHLFDRMYEARQTPGSPAELWRQRQLKAAIFVLSVPHKTPL